MKTVIKTSISRLRMRLWSSFIFIALALGSLALTQRAQAVTPAPDGGYPGGNTAEGQNALLGLTTGTYNTAVGWFSLRSNTTGQFNTALGAGALLANVGNPSSLEGVQNTATGAAALLSNTAGYSNTANGAFALASNTVGGANTAVGSGALSSNTVGTQNTANGVDALENNTTGTANTATGTDALASNTTGFGNTANGNFALLLNIGGSDNTAVGVTALRNTTGGANTAVGLGAGGNVTTGSFNVYIGTDVGGVADEVGHTYISNISSTVQPPGGNVEYVTINLDTKLLGHSSSSRRYKQDITPIANASEALFRLKPVTYHYRKEIDPKQPAAFGLIAEEVAEVNPQLVARNSKGQPESVHYDQVNAMLLNEFLKEHKKVEEQQATIVELKSTVAQQRKDFETTAAQQQKTLRSKFAEQKSQIQALASDLQKVSAAVELNRPATKEVALKQGTTASQPSKEHDGSESVTP